MEPDDAMTARRRGGARLVERLRAGDERAWARWYDELAPAVRGYARSKGARDPDDLVGEVFAAAAGRIGDFDGDERRLRAWVFTIAHHRLAAEHRRRSRRGDDAALATDLLDRVAWPDDPIDSVEGRIDAEGALALLGSLTDDQREVLALRVVADLSLAETAEVTGRPIGAVKALQHRALGRLHRVLAADPHLIGASDDGMGGHA